MLFDTLRRKNQAEQEEREWNANRPADYVSRNKDAMDSLTGQIGSGFDWDTGSKAYQQYRAQAQANAAASAENAQANAAMLAGGYGSSYADSVAKQGQQQALSGIDNAVPGLRGQALSEYQNQQNDLLSALSGMADTEALDRSAYGSNFANYTAWQNFLANQSEQARNENDNYWNNLWNTVKNIGSAALTAYDGYKGYTQQQWENDFAREQWEYNKERTGQSDALNAYEQAFNLYQQGAGDAANAVLGRYGLDTGIFDNYSGAPITRADKAGALTTAAGLAGGGSDEAARAVLELYGLDPNSVGNYRTIAGRQLATTLATKSAGGSGSSSGRRSSRTKSSGSSPTYAQLLSMSKEFVTMKASDPRYDHYKRTLTDAGWIKDDTPNLLETNRGLTGQSWKGDPANKWGTGTSNRQSQSTGRTASQSSVPQRAQVAANAIKGQRNHGSDDQTIFDSLKYQGYTDDEIWKAFELAG